MTSPKVWKAAELIHARLCCQTLESCFEGNGDCVKAAYKLYRDGLLNLEKPVATEKEIGPEDGWYPVRERTLDSAARLISGDRAKDYGDAAESFTRLAALWSPILGVDVTPEQVALCLTQLKVSRLIVTPAHTDSWVDAAGYIALGSEIAARGRDES